MNEKFLPIGTVIKLKKSPNLMMIIGYCPSGVEKMYDYSGCIFPDGIISLNKNFVFNTEDISEIYYFGYKNSEYDELNQLLLEKINSSK